MWQIQGTKKAYDRAQSRIQAFWPFVDIQDCLSSKAICCLLNYVIQEENLLKPGQALLYCGLMSASPILGYNPVLKITSCSPTGDSYILAAEIQCKLLKCFMLLLCCRQNRGDYHLTCSCSRASVHRESQRVGLFRNPSHLSRASSFTVLVQTRAHYFYSHEWKRGSSFLDRSGCFGPAFRQAW